MSEARISTPIISLNNVTAGYDGRPQINGVSIDVMPRDFVGIIGRNGGGKTTLLRVILSLLRPMEGSVSYHNDKGMKCPYLHMGYLPQHSIIDTSFPICVAEVIEQGLLGRHTSIQKKARTQLMEDIMDEMALTHLARQPIGQLSGGELQRTLLARALVGQPQVLVLDEPNTFIDKTTTTLLDNVLDRVKQHTTIIMVSHNVEDIKKKATILVEMDEQAHITR